MMEEDKDFMMLKLLENIYERQILFEAKKYSNAIQLVDCVWQLIHGRDNVCASIVATSE